jgi:hypothetical protein
LVLAVGCESQRQRRNGQAVRPPNTPSFQQLADAQNHRVAELEKVYASGVIEIRWTDDKGDHKEQGDMELWLHLPKRTALRVDKLGEVLLWLGSDEQHYWFFDLLAKEKTLIVGEHDGPPVLAHAGVLGVKPLALLDLMGLTPLRGPDSGEPEVQFDSELGAWVVSAVGNGGPMRIFFDTSTHLPLRVETCSDQGDVLLFSSLKEYETVDLPNRLSVGSPKMAELIDIVSAAGLEAGASTPLRSAEVKIAVNEATARFAHEELDRVFDLERLIKAMNPDRLEGSWPAQAAAVQSPIPDVNPRTR